MLTLMNSSIFKKKDFGYTKRQVGQSLKDFMQQIIKDQNKYAGMKDKIKVRNNTVKNVTKIHDRT